MTDTTHKDTGPKPQQVFPEDPRDTDVVRNYYACQSHCCVRHGCKYGYHGCPVATGQVTQDHPCEQCTYELDDHFDGDYARPGEVGYAVVFAATRTTDADGTAMTGMPTDEEVQHSVTEALIGLDLGNGWTITRVPEKF